MGERIYVGGIPSNNVNNEYKSLFDVRYVGIKQKERVHPRIIIRKIHNVSNLSGVSLPSLGASQIEFNNFILEQVDEPVQEKFQIVKTFGPDFLFLFGPAPRIFSYTGRLFNTADKPWKDQFQRAWDRNKAQGGGSLTQPVSDSTQLPEDNHYLNSDIQQGILSGTNVILHGGRLRLEYDGSVDLSGSGIETEQQKVNAKIIREGYLLKMDIKLMANNQNRSPFQLTMYVTNTMTF
jgi:hypothetical protein